MFRTRKSHLVVALCLIFLTGAMLTAQAELKVRIVCPGSAIAGQELGNTIKVWVRNAGNKPAAQFALDLVLSKSPSIPVALATYSPNYSDGVLLLGGREHVNALNPGQEILVTLNGKNKIPADTPPGRYFLAAVVDPGKVIPERNENNNVARCRIFIRGTESPGQSDPGQRKADLIVSDIRLIKDCKIQVTLKNIGHAGVPADRYTLPDAVGVQMYKDGTPWGGIILSGFDPDGHLKTPGGSASWIWFPGAANLNLSPGAHNIKVEVDNNNKLDEESESNNTLSRTLRCGESQEQEPAIGIPQRFFLDFTDAYLVHEPGSQTLQIATEQMVLSYGGDWQKARVKPFLFHLRQQNWKGFYWLVNTSRKEIHRVNGSHFGSIGDRSGPALDCVVDVVGNKEDPTRFFLRFKEAYLVFVPSSKTLQIVAYQNVLSYGSDWQKCQLKPYLFHLRQNVWKGFFWKINTSRKQSYRVNGGSFCSLGGSDILLQMGVRVVN